LKFMIVIAAAVTVLSLGACDKVSDEVFGQRVRSYLLKNPEVIEEVVARLEQKQQAMSADRAAAGKANIGKLRTSIERDARDVVINPNGKITVVEFQDYRCGYCKVAGPHLVKLVKENPDIRFVIKEMPIFGGVSTKAASIALATKSSGKSLEIYQRFLAAQDLNDAEIDRILTSLSLDPAETRKAAADPAIERHLADNHRLADQLGITGTPNFIVGDTMIVGANMPALKQAIDAAS